MMDKIKAFSSQSKNKALTNVLKAVQDNPSPDDFLMVDSKKILEAINFELMN